MTNFKCIIGIDVSKDTLDIYNSSTEQFYQIQNTNKSIHKWIKKLKSNTLYVFEPTGSYSDKLVHLLAGKGFSISLVNPLQSSGFAKAQGIISKNDKQASKTLALMGQVLELPLFKKQEDIMYKRKQLILGVNALKKQRQMLKNQLHALSHQVIFAPKVKMALEQTLNTVELQLKELEDELNDLSDEEHQQQLELITSVVGIGKVTANLLLTATGGLQNFQRPRQLSKFLRVYKKLCQ